MTLQDIQNYDDIRNYKLHEGTKQRSRSLKEESSHLADI